MLVDYLVEHGTLHKAAKLLSISQPAATGMLNDLERLLGLALFIRSRSGMTPACEMLRLLDKMRTLKREFGDFAAALEGLAQGSDLVLRVGAVPQAFVTYLPHTIARFRAAAPLRLRRVNRSSYLCSCRLGNLMQ